MNEYDNEVAHPGNGINTSKTTALRPNLAIRHRHVTPTYEALSFDTRSVLVRPQISAK
jgi:hypothetical protein